jgi:phenylalanyl-tRNA synthetase alpha subunit
MTVSLCAKQIYNHLVNAQLSKQLKHVLTSCCEEMFRIFLSCIYNQYQTPALEVNVSPDTWNYTDYKQLWLFMLLAEHWGNVHV